MRFGFGVPSVLDAPGIGTSSGDGVIAAACHPVVNVVAFLARSSIHLWSSGANVVFLGSVTIPGTGLGKDDDGATHILWQPQGKAIGVATRHHRILFFDADIVITNEEVFTGSPPNVSTCNLSNVASRVKFRTEVRLNYGIITGLTGGGKNAILAITSGGFVCCVGWHHTQLVHAWNTVFLSSAQHSIEFDTRVSANAEYSYDGGSAPVLQNIEGSSTKAGKVSPSASAAGFSSTQLQVHATKESVFSGTIVSVAFNSALQLLSLTLSDGLVALLEGLNDDRIVYGDSVCFTGSCVRIPSVAKVAINAQHRLLAAATLGGGVSCKRIDSDGLSLTQFWSNSRWCEEQRNFGAVSDLVWSPDEETLLVSFHHHGIVLLHFSGVCLLSTFSRYDVGTPGSLSMRSSDPGFSDYNRRRANSLVLSHGCSSVCWDPTGHRVYAVEVSSRRAYVLPLAQAVSASEVCSVANSSPIALFDGSRLYLSHCSSKEGSEGEWEVAPCPPLYLQRGYPLAYCEVSSSGEHIVCAGALGFALFHRRVRRWRIPPLDRICSSIVCVATPAWIQNEAVVLPVRCCTNQNNFELQVYSRFLPSGRELVAKSALPRKPIMVRTSTGATGQGWIIALTTANDMIFYQYKLNSDHVFAPHEVSVTLSYTTRVDLHERIHRPLDVLCVPPKDHNSAFITSYSNGRGRADSSKSSSSNKGTDSSTASRQRLLQASGSEVGQVSQTEAPLLSLPSLYILQRNHQLVGISFSSGTNSSSYHDTQTGTEGENGAGVKPSVATGDSTSPGKTQQSSRWGRFSSWGAPTAAAKDEKQLDAAPPGEFLLTLISNEPVYRVWRDASAPVEGAALILFENSGLSCVVVRESSHPTHKLYCKYKFSLAPLDGDVMPLGLSVYDGYIVMGTEGRVRKGFATVWQDRVFPHFTLSTKRAHFQHTLAIAAIADGFHIPTTPVHPLKTQQSNGDKPVSKDSGKKSLTSNEKGNPVSTAPVGQNETDSHGTAQVARRERDAAQKDNGYDAIRAPSVGPLYSLGNGFVAWLETMRENGTFTSVMDYMLHFITNEKDKMNINFVDDRAILLQLVSFLRLYPEFYEIVIGFVRKIDAVQWQMVLDVVGSPVDFFFECVASNRLQEAAQLIQIIMMGEGPLLDSVINHLKQKGGVSSLALSAEYSTDGKLNTLASSSSQSPSTPAGVRSTQRATYGTVNSSSGDVAHASSQEVQLLEATTLCAQHLFIVVIRNRDFQLGYEVLRFSSMLQDALAADTSKPAVQRPQENVKQNVTVRERSDSSTVQEYSANANTNAVSGEAVGQAQGSIFTRALRSVGILASPEEAAAMFPVETGECFAQLSSADVGAAHAKPSQPEAQLGRSTTDVSKMELSQSIHSTTQRKEEDGTSEDQTGIVQGTPFKFVGNDVTMSNQGRQTSHNIFRFLCLREHRPLLTEMENVSTDLLFAGCLSQLDDLLRIFSIDAVHFLTAKNLSLPQLPTTPEFLQKPEDESDQLPPPTAAGAGESGVADNSNSKPPDASPVITHQSEEADYQTVDRPLNAILLFDALHDEYGLPRCPGKPQEPHVHPELPPPFFQAPSLDVSRRHKETATSENKGNITTATAAGKGPLPNDGGNAAASDDVQQREELERAERREAVKMILRKTKTATQEYLSHNPAVFEKLVRMRRLMIAASIPEYQMALSLLCLDAVDVAKLANTYPSLRDALRDLVTHPCYAGYQPFVSLCLSL